MPLQDAPTMFHRIVLTMISSAIQYALNQEVALRCYCEDDRLEIDNNAAERMLRLIAIGRYTESNFVLA